MEMIHLFVYREKKEDVQATDILLCCVLSGLGSRNVFSALIFFNTHFHTCSEKASGASTDDGLLHMIEFSLKNSGLRDKILYLAVSL